MEKCKGCIHENVCEHRANIQTDTYAYMGVKYDTEKCEHFMPADVVPKSEVIEMLDEIYAAAWHDIDHYDIRVMVVQLKMKYTEGETDGNGINKTV